MSILEGYKEISCTLYLNNIDHILNPHVAEMFFKQWKENSLDRWEVVEEVGYDGDSLPDTAILVVLGDDSVVETHRLW